MTMMNAENWAAMCKAQQTMKCKKCGKVTYTWKELLEHRKKNWNHFDYVCVGFINSGVCFA